MNWTEEQYEEYQRKCGILNTIQPAKKPKYNNNRIKVDGILFDSQFEADYYNNLKLQLRMGTIKGFCRQAQFILLEGFAGSQPEIYKADFIVFNLDGTAEVIDTKGVETEVFKIKHKQFKAKFPGLDIKIERGEGL